MEESIATNVCSPGHQFPSGGNMDVLVFQIKIIKLDGGKDDGWMDR